MTMSHCLPARSDIFFDSRALLTQAFPGSKQQRRFTQVFPAFSSSLSRRTLLSNEVSASLSQASPGFKKPAVIEWQEDMPTNRATLIGTIVREVRIRYLDTGKIVANTSIKVTRPIAEDSWFYLEFLGDLAEIAAAHLKVDDHIFVSGSVWSETVKGKDNIEKTFAKVVVEDLKFVNQLNIKKVENSSIARVQELNGEALWKDLFENSREWCDCRGERANDRYPDFKHVSSGKALWLDSGFTPKWVIERLEKESGHNFIRFRSAEEKWKDFFADPSRWWDNRARKVNPRYPDFKHKDTEDALWISNKATPDWVIAKLTALDSGEKE